MRGSGFLAIWSDVSVAHETDYLHWLTREHTAERLGVDGFLMVRVYRSTDPELRRYFIRYELRSPDVVASAAYLARLNDPTPWSRRIMPVLRNFARGGGRVVARAGEGVGGTLAALRLDSLPASDGRSLVETIVRSDRIVAAELLATDPDGTAIRTHEKAMRERDASFDALLLVEGLDAAAVSLALVPAGYGLSGNLYAQIFQLGPLA